MAERVAPLQASFTALREELERQFAVSGNRKIFGAIRAVKAVDWHLRRPLRIAVMGEQSSGKSTLINMLLRESVVPAGAFAGLKAHFMLRYGADTALYVIGPDGSRTRLTSKALARISTPGARSAPGTNIIYNAMDPALPRPREDLQSLSLLPGAMRPVTDGAAKLIEIVLPHPFLQRAELMETRAYPQNPAKSVLRRVYRPVDAAIWCTLSTQAWKETERQTWRRLPASLRQNAILLVTYRDAIRTAQDEAKILTRLRRDAGSLFSEIMVVSLRHALEAMSVHGMIADHAKWDETGAPQFESGLRARLDALQWRRFQRSAAFLRRLSGLISRSDPNSPLPARSAEAIHELFERSIGQIEAAGAVYFGPAKTGDRNPFFAVTSQR